MALQPFNSVSGFSVGETPTVIISNTGNVSGNTANFSGNLTALNANLGNLTLSNNFTGNFINGNSNIVIVANGAIEISSTGNANVLIVSGTGANITGNLSVSGNANVGNIGATGFYGVSGNLTGNLVAGNIDAGNLLTVSFANISSNANIGNIGTAIITATGNITGANLFTGGIVSATSNVSGGNITTAGQVSATGNVTGNFFIGNGSQLTGLNTSGLSNGTSNISIPTVDGNILFGVAGQANVFVVANNGATVGGNLTTTGNATIEDGVIATASNANLVLEPNGTGVVVIANTSGGATAIEMGDPTQGNLVSNAVTLTNSSSVSNAIALLNNVLGKLVPNSPSNFPGGQTLSIGSLSSFRMANYTQTDNTSGANKGVAGGTTVSSVLRASGYTTSNISTVGPGDSGTIATYLNGTLAGSRTLTANLDGNGTYSNLVIFNNYDYNVANANIPAGFWSVFSARASGTVTQGWNEVYIADSAATNTNIPYWFYDSSSPGTPQFSSTSISAPGAPSYAYSSTVPHYDNTNAFNLAFNVNRLSGNMYPVSDTFITGTAGGAFGTPTSLTYTTAGVGTPLAQNLYVASGSLTANTNSTIISGFGASSSGPSLSALNSYATGTQAFSPGANVLYKTGTVSSATRIEEANVFIGSTIGSGSGLAVRIDNPGSGNTPTFTGSEANFNSQSSTLQAYDATVVANILKHDQTNYSTGYLPVGPNLSSGRAGTQYFTFKVVRTSVSKFDVKWTGTVAGMWVALPGSIIDSTSGANGWIDMSVAYAGSGAPGQNIGSGGNGSDGCALGGVAPLNSAQTNKSVTATFGTVSSSSTADNEIYIRIALTSGQSVTALSLQTASN